MNQDQTQQKSEVQNNLDRLQTLRDEVKVRLHLAGMDAKDTWNKLEPRIDDVERQVAKAADELTDATRAALNDVIGRLQKLRDSLH